MFVISAKKACKMHSSGWSCHMSQCHFLKVVLWVGYMENFTASSFSHRFSKMLLFSQVHEVSVRPNSLAKSCFDCNGRDMKSWKKWASILCISIPVGKNYSRVINLFQEAGRSTTVNLSLSGMASCWRRLAHTQSDRPLLLNFAKSIFRIFQVCSLSEFGTKIYKSNIEGVLA